MAASLAALPSMVIFSGTPWRWIALVRNRLAACSSRCSVRRKSMVWPVLSTARERIPLAFELDGGFVHTPTHPHRALAPVERLFTLGAVLHDPALARRMVEEHATL